MKKINEVSKKIKDSTDKVESQVKLKLLPKIKGYETVILYVLVAMVVAGLVSGKGLMLVAGVLTALVVGLPKYSNRLSKKEPLVDKDLVEPVIQEDVVPEVPSKKAKKTSAE
jgi:hypothetical protein